MRRLPSLKALQVFEAAARLGAFAAAADELHLTASAVSHQIRGLEQALGTTLFHRVHRAVVLSDAGRRYAESVADAFGRLEGATRDIERVDKADVLTVHAVPSFATQWLMPRLPRFAALYPDIDLRLHAGTELVDLATGEADVDIRYGHAMPDTGVAIEPFPEETIVVLACPPVRGQPRLRRPSDLVGRTLIHSEMNLYKWRDWLADHPGVTLELSRGLRFDRSFMAIHAAADGLGIALESRLLLQRELDAGRLVLPLGGGGPRMVCHRMSFLKTKHHLPKMRHFHDWLFGELARSTAAGQA